MPGYSKENQTYKKQISKKECSSCLKIRDIKFFSTPRALKCNTCKAKARRLSKYNSVSSSKKRAWKSFSTYIRTRDSLATTGTRDSCRCITCEKVVPYKNIQAGHFIGGRGGSVLFDERVVNGQCVRCNIMLKGNYDSYNFVMLKKYGGDEVVRMLERKWHVVQYKTSDYKDIEEEYKEKLKKL